MALVNRPCGKHMTALRRALRREQDRVCALCGDFIQAGGGPTPNKGVVDPPDSPSLDHIIRQRDGGTWEKSNLRLVHRRCNEERD